MNVREEDRQKSGCSSRGLGVAATVIGVGVGAALCYFFSKRAENPHTEGSTSDWNCEQPETFHPLIDESEDSYTTISEHETTDTSINRTFSTESPVTSDYESSSDSDTDDDSEMSNMTADSYFEFDNYETGYFTSPVESGSDVGDEWDVTSSSIGIPDMEIPSSVTRITSSIGTFITPRRSRKSEESNLRQQQFRERSWTLEECSICFDVMLRGQEVMSLPCTHNFHTQCILPWLQEKQTCPNCRKVAE